MCLRSMLLFAVCHSSRHGSQSRHVPSKGGNKTTTKPKIGEGEGRDVPQYSALLCCCGQGAVTVTVRSSVSLASSTTPRALVGRATGVVSNEWLEFNIDEAMAREGAVRMQ